MDLDCERVPSSSERLGSSPTHLGPVEDSDLDEAAGLLLVVQDAVGGEATVAVVVELDPSRQAVGVLG